jgi:hypothetical protein
MAIAKSSMQPLFSKLQKSGLDAKFVKTLLPEWWDDSLANTPSGYQQAALILARIFAIRPDSLWSSDSAPVFAIPEKRKFKHSVDTEPAELDVACALAFSAAKIASSGLEALPFLSDIPSAAQLRQQLLQENKWIGLQELVNYCYSIGVPVIYLEKFPAGAKKMHGLAFDCNGRPIIVLTRKYKRGYLLFDLAHELGHIALNHLSQGGFIVDNVISADDADEDDDERAANRFALELLTGDPEKRIGPSGRNLKKEELASAALAYAKKNQIDPTHIAMNYGHTTKHWGVANGAVSIIGEGTLTDCEILKEALFKNLDQDEMKEDDISALKGMVGLES